MWQLATFHLMQWMLSPSSSLVMRAVSPICPQEGVHPSSYDGGLLIRRFISCLNWAIFSSLVLGAVHHEALVHPEDVHVNARRFLKAEQ